MRADSRIQKMIQGNCQKGVMILFALLPIVSQAQCAMCRAALETSEDTGKAEAVNDGIVYLMAVPYLLVAVLGYFVYRLYSKKKA